MKAFLLFTVFSAAILQSAYSQPGTLDASFGTGGVVSSVLDGKNLHAVAVAVQSDGKIVVACETGSFKDDNLVILRFNANGSADNTFNGKGAVITTLANKSVTDMKLQEDGKIVVSAYTQAGDSSVAILLRYNTDGTPDNSFGSQGRVRVVAGKSTYVYGITILPGGAIIGAGVVIFSWTDYHSMLFKVKTDGSLDEDFGFHGIVRTSKEWEPNRAVAVAPRKDRSMVSAGYNSKSANYNFEIIDFNEYGKTTWSEINKEGRVDFNVKDNYSKANSISILDDGKILLGGSAGNQAKSDFAIMRLTALGKPDKTFGAGGKIIADISKAGRCDELAAMLVQPDGKILAAGGSHNGEYDGTVEAMDVVTARYNNDGSPDNTFGTGGVAKYAAAGMRYYSVSSMAVQPDGKIIVASTEHGKGDTYKVVLLRYNN